MSGQGVLVFLYGTLLDPAVLDAKAGVKGLHRQLRPARLSDYARVFLRGSPYPTLLPRPGAEVAGAVLRLPPAPLARLAAYEGPSYALRPVRVSTARGPLRALAWMAPPWRADPRPWDPPPRPPRRRAVGVRA
ncbi:MAG: gamma-glutamylcyclotransferase family protein [Rhodovarius sp.]|nr:gamma-glutamylcyclotransferase [Rhodovarius sp.]MCX7933214.1 gamma-glutamylcyclotransferase [Rhodovarius sp.]MDW8314685.1 gamma-glutamylcyclotransferase family protein [Rhodovarius sp.]